MSLFTLPAPGACDPKPIADRSQAERVLPAKHRCGLCATIDPDEYAQCDRRICFSEPIPTPSPFGLPGKLVSAFELAARMRRRADALDWDQDAERGRLMQRARELERGDSAEVPDEAA